MAELRAVFADSGYFIGLLNPGDQWRTAAIAASAETRDAGLVTSELVLVETVNFFSKSGPHVRMTASSWARQALSGQRLQVVPFDLEVLQAALELFSARLDKQWSLTDCTSIAIMQRLGIREVLTADRHFEQAGFTVLLKQ